MTRTDICWYRAGRVALLLALLLSGEGRADGKTISSSEIARESINEGCLDYRVVGGCVWMTCYALACEFDWSVMVRHRIPEVVVTSYPFLNRSGWSNANGNTRPNAFAQEGGFSDEGGSSKREQALKFKNVDIKGSPGVTAYWAFHQAQDDVPFCRPMTYPTVPYFLSHNDAPWRDPIYETGLTLKNYLSTIGQGASRFSGLFPRIGFVHQGHDYKASLVAAIRAMDIVTKAYQPHVYLPLNTFYTSNQGQWPPRGTNELVWQQLVPQTAACTALPEIDDTGYLSDPYAGRQNMARGNVWNAWRPYRCCPRKGAVLIAHWGEDQ